MADNKIQTVLSETENLVPEKAKVDPKDVFSYDQLLRMMDGYARLQSSVADAESRH